MIFFGRGGGWQGVFGIMPVNNTTLVETYKQNIFKFLYKEISLKMFFWGRGRKNFLGEANLFSFLIYDHNPNNLKCKVGERNGNECGGQFRAHKREWKNSFLLC